MEKMMDLWFFLMELVMLLGGAFLMGALAQRLGQSPILGYLLAGTVVGPLIADPSAVNQAAELGVSLLLFSIGLEFSFTQLRKMGRMAFGGGTVQIIATLLFGTFITVSQVALPVALTLGAIVALSSTTLVLRLLVDRAEIDSVRGRTCLGILLLQDIAIVPLVLMVSLFTPAASGSTGFGPHTLKIILAVVGLAAAFYLLLHRLIPILFSEKALFANRELTVLLAIAVGLGSALAAHSVKLSPALGAFVAGMLLGESPFATQIRADIGALRIIMVTLFFASVGMLAKPLWLLTQLHWVLLAALSIFIVKSIVIFGVGRLFGLNKQQALASGITLAQIGEFSFVLAAAAREGGILDSSLMDLTISVIIVLMLATPYMVEWASPLAEGFISLFSRRTPQAGLQGKTEGGESINRILVIGLGPAGRQVVHSLREGKLEPVVIDINPKSREFTKETGVKVHLGDAGHEDILMHAGLSGVCMAVVTVPDPGAALRIVQMIRRLRPQLIIAARCRFNRHFEDLKEAGADIIIDEENAVGGLLSRQVMDHLRDSSGSMLACRLGGQSPEVSAQAD